MKTQRLAKSKAPRDLTKMLARQFLDLQKLRSEVLRAELAAAAKQRVEQSKHKAATCISEQPWGELHAATIEWKALNRPSSQRQPRNWKR